MPALILTLLFIAIGWFLLIRPQQQRLKQQQMVIASLEPGDQVITAGGIHGFLRKVEVDTVRIEVAEGVVLTLARPAIARRIGDENDSPATGPAGVDPPAEGSGDSAEPRYGEEGR